jgi:hypothetical protein
MLDKHFPNRVNTKPTKKNVTVHGFTVSSWTVGDVTGSSVGGSGHGVLGW